MASMSVIAELSLAEVWLSFLMKSAPSRSNASVLSELWASALEKIWAFEITSFTFAASIDLISVSASSDRICALLASGPMVLPRSAMLASASSTRPALWASAIENCWTLSTVWWMPAALSTRTLLARSST